MRTYSREEISALVDEFENYSGEFTRRMRIYLEMHGLLVNREIIFENFRRPYDLRLSPANVANLLHVGKTGCDRRIFRLDDEVCRDGTIPMLCAVVLYGPPGTDYRDRTPLFLAENRAQAYLLLEASGDEKRTQALAVLQEKEEDGQRFLNFPMVDTLYLKLLSSFTRTMMKKDSPLLKN